MVRLITPVTSLASVVSAVTSLAPQPSVVTICPATTSQAIVPDAGLSDPFSAVMSAGSSASRLLVQADPRALLNPQMFTAYSSAFKSFQTAVSNIQALNNADITEITAVNAQLAAVLHALANTYGPLMNLIGFTALVHDLKVSANMENDAVNSMLRAVNGVSCGNQNSLNGVGSQLSSAFGVMEAKTWMTPYLTEVVPWTAIPSVNNCPDGCYTVTLIAPAGTTATTTAPSSAASATDSNSEVTSSRTVSGSVERCLVRPTGVTSVATPIVSVF